MMKKTYDVIDLVIVSLLTGAIVIFILGSILAHDFSRKESAFCNLLQDQTEIAADIINGECWISFADAIILAGDYDE